MAFSISCPPSSPVTLATTIDITADLTIAGPGPNDLVVSGNNVVSVFNVASGVTATISGLTVEDGNANFGGGIMNGGALTARNIAVLDNTANGGGGIDNQGTLVVDASTVSGTSGDGIANDNGATATVSNSTVLDNRANNTGGGIVNAGRINDEIPGNLTVTDTTLSGNSATDYGGGIASGGPLHLTDSTLTGNTAGGRGGGIETFGGTMTVANSTVADNTSIYGGGINNDGSTTTGITNTTLTGNRGTYGANLYNFAGAVSVDATIVANSISGKDCGGSLTDDGYNLDDDSSCGFTASTDLSDTHAGLDGSGLKSNGGATQTIALKPGSAAIGAVKVASLCLTPDQRGIERPTPCDIGAYETDTTAKAQAIMFDSTPPSNATYEGTPYMVSASGGDSGTPVTFTVDSSSSSVCAVSGATVTFQGIGTCTIDANQAGDRSYSAAPQVQQTFSVGAASQAIAFTSTAPSDATVDGPSYIVSASGGDSGIAVVFSIEASATSVCQVYQTDVTFQGVGTCIIDANQAGTTDYNSAPEVQQTFSVGPEADAITSPNTWTVTERDRVGFLVTTTGTSVPTIAEKGQLPPHIRFKDNHDGTARFSGRATKTGTFTVTIKARFGKSKTKHVVSQVFTLTVNPR